jgi:hypothetical protein
MLTGVYAARNITGEQHDVWSVNTEKEYLENGRSATLNRGERLVPSRVTVRVEERVEQVDDDTIEAIFAKLDPLALGVALGVVSSVGLLLATAILLLKDGEHIGQTLTSQDFTLVGVEYGSVAWKRQPSDSHWGISVHR